MDRVYSRKFEARSSKSIAAITRFAVSIVSKATRRRRRRRRIQVEGIPRRGATKDPYDRRAKHVVLRVFVSYTGSTGFSACPRVFKKPDNYGEQYWNFVPKFSISRNAYFIVQSLLRDAHRRESFILATFQSRGISYYRNT